jgi:hypothetical protein
MPISKRLCASSALLRHGWQLRAMARHAGTLEGGAWIRGDARMPGPRAARHRGVDVIVHAVYPPSYRG